MGYYITADILHEETCKKCINAINGGFRYEYFENFDAVYGREVRACKCCKTKYQNYKEYKHIEEQQEAFLKLVVLYANQYNYRVQVFDNADIEIQSNVEKWIIHINSFEDTNVAKVVLYHRNNLNYSISKNKCGSSIYPEYHVQFKRTATPSELVTYVMNHEKNKWGVQVTKYADGAVLNKI